MGQSVPGVELLTDVGGVVVATGTPFVGGMRARPTWARMGSLYLLTSDEIASATLTPSIDVFPQGDAEGGLAAENWMTFGTMTTETIAYHLTGALTASDWIAEGGWNSQTVVSIPPAYQLRLVVTGGGASFNVLAVLHWLR